MLKSLLGLLYSNTGRDTAIVFVGTLINAMIGGLFFIIAPRLLGPAQYGLFAVVTSTALLVANLANFGIDTGILKFTDLSNKIQTNKILKLALEAYLVIGIVAFILGFFLSHPISKILNNETLAPLLQIGFAGIILFLLTDFFITVLQSQKKFAKATAVNISANVTRILILALGAYFFTVNLYFLTVLFFTVSVVSVIVGKVFVPLDFLKAKDHRQEFKKFFTYNLWIAASTAISSIPFDNYLLLKFAGPIAVGLYAAPFKILSVVAQFAGNFSSVLAPRYSSFDNNGDAIRYSKKVMPIVVIVVLVILFAAVIANPLVTLLLGREYVDSIGIFRIISVSYAFYFSETIAVSMIVYYFGKTKVAFWITAITITFWVLFDILLIPAYHELGAAIAQLISAVMGTCLFAAYIIWKLSKNEKHEH